MAWVLIEYEPGTASFVQVATSCMAWHGFPNHGSMIRGTAITQINVVQRLNLRSCGKRP
jgi:hypothetical protein